MGNNEGSVCMFKKGHKTIAMETISSSNLVTISCVREGKIKRIFFC